MNFRLFGTGAFKEHIKYRTQQIPRAKPDPAYQSYRDRF